MMDAVLKATGIKVAPEPDVLGQPAEGAPGPTAPVEGQAGEPQPKEGEDDLSAVDPEAPLPPDASNEARKKVRKLLNERRELRAQVEAMGADAQIGNRLNSFAHENNLSADDIVLGLSAMASLQRGDYADFYRQVAPYVRRAQEVLGLVLPDDLGQRVQQGMPEQAARELAQARFREMRASEEAKAHAARYQAQQIGAVQADVQRAVNTFEERLAANDPDYRAKAEAVKRVAQALLHERGGRITSVKEALDIVQAAHREVTAQYSKFVPQLRSTSPQPSGFSQQPNARAAPKTLMEAALVGLENARRRAG